MERIKKGIALITGFCLFWTLILFITSATVCNIAGDRSLMAVEMRRHASPKVTGLPDKEYSEMGLMITDYLMGRRESFQYYYTDAEGNLTVAFHPHEEEHMADCRELIRKTGILRWIAGGASLVLLAACVVLRKYRKSLSTGTLAAFALAFVGGVFVMLWWLRDFDGLFIAFHRLLFTNEGWLLDTRTDLLIRLMPTSFFVSMGVRLALAVAAMALAALCAAITIRMIGKNEAEEEAPGAGTAAQEA